MDERKTSAKLANKAVELFISYAHEDESLKDELVRHLRMMQRNGEVAIWHDREITGGREWKGEIDNHLERAGLIILLVSADFINSDYCWDVEMTRAMDRHEDKTARVVPIILRKTDLKNAPFMKLQALPTNAQPVTDLKYWTSRDEAWVKVVHGLRLAIAELSPG